MRSVNPIPLTPFAGSFRLSILILCVLCASAVDLPAQDFKTVAPGVEYAEVTREIDKQPVRMNLLRLDLTKVRLDVVHAKDAAIGLEKTSSIAIRHRAFAAINGGFFRMDDSIWAGDPAGLLIVDGELLSDPAKDRIVAGFSNGRISTDVKFGRSKLTLAVKISKRTIEISGTNRELLNDEIILFTGLYR